MGTAKDDELVKPDFAPGFIAKENCLAVDLNGPDWAEIVEVGKLVAYGEIVG